MKKKTRLRKHKKNIVPPAIQDLSAFKKLLEQQREVQELTYFLFLKGSRIEANLSAGGLPFIKKIGLTMPMLVEILKALGEAEKKAMSRLKLMELENDLY